VWNNVRLRILYSVSVSSIVETTNLIHDRDIEELGLLVEQSHGKIPKFIRVGLKNCCASFMHKSA
jgi:hypothetical protein